MQGQKCKGLIMKQSTLVQTSRIIQSVSQILVQYLMTHDIVANWYFFLSLKLVSNSKYM
jgi:hypothetical protein